MRDETEDNKPKPQETTVGDAKMTADERVAAARIGRFHEHVAIDAVWCADAIAIAEAHAAAAVAEVAKERDEARRDADHAKSVLRVCERDLRTRIDDARQRAKQSEARVADLEALLREAQELFMEAGPFHALRPAVKAQWKRRARAHINALASTLAPQAPKEVQP